MLNSDSQPSTWTNEPSIHFDFNENDSPLFTEDQQRHWKEIEDFYLKLLKRCRNNIEIPTSGTHKNWISQRVTLHVTTSLMRLLYLAESFCDASKKFNFVAAAVHVKAMVEVPLHLGYLVWILDSHSDFQSIKEHLFKLSFGNRDPNTGLTSSAKIPQRTLYKKADKMMDKFFKDDPQKIKIFETLYKEANATGHHNYEGRNISVGVMLDKTWEIRDRKTWFVFLTNNIFQCFLHASAVFSMSFVFLDALDHYLTQMPENLPYDSKATAKMKYEEIRNLFKRLSDEMCKVVESYYIWETLVFSRAIPEVGKEVAEKNAKTMTIYKDFFVTTEHNHMEAFILGISKFFDRDSRALSIQQLIGKIKESQDLITADFFKEHFPDRLFPEDFKDGYKPIHDEDIKFINGLREKHDALIGILKIIRDKQIAHTDIEIIENKETVRSFVPKEVIELIEAIQQMFNKLSSRFESSTTVWDHMKRDSVGQTKYLLENLERGENAMREEFSKEYKEKWDRGPKTP